MATWKGITQPLSGVGLRFLKLSSPSLRVGVFLAILVISAGLLVWLGPGRSLWNGEQETPRSGTDTLTVQQLMPVLTRSGVGPDGIGVDVTYTPTLFFEVTGQDAPSGNSVVFFLQENVHQGALSPIPPQVYLIVDDAGKHAPMESKVVVDDIHHRTTRLLFQAGTVGEGARTISMVIPMADGTVSAGNTLTWNLPLQLPDGSAIGGTSGSAQAARQPDALSGAQLSTMTQALRRVREDVSYGGVQGIKLEATYATPEYLKVALPPEMAGHYVADKSAVFIVSESAHAADLPETTPPFALQLDKQTYAPDLTERRVSSPHHRVTMLRFPVDPRQARSGDTLALQLPDGSHMRWQLPIAYQGAQGLSPFGMSWASLLAVLAGMIAAMWPCLFQLTVFFIPTLAGLSMQETRGAVTLGRRFQVVRAAFFFVLGFTLVYTVAGALIGLAAQRLGETPNFEQVQRYVGIGGGIIIIILALRTAAKVRAPLVCKMPILSRMGHSHHAANPLELMFAGLAFATGCMTCFGAALVIAMVVYVGLSASPAFGALTLFLFSLGMGIPLVIAATAMAKVLPLLFRLEKVLPWMGLASSLLMVGFAILLITGNYMALTEWVYRSIPVAAIR